MKDYLLAHRFQTATAASLWASVSKSTGEPVDEWMQPWTYRPGYPVVTVTLGGPTQRDVLVSQVCDTQARIQ